MSELNVKILNNVNWVKYRLGNSNHTGRQKRIDVNNNMIKNVLN